MQRLFAFGVWMIVSSYCFGDTFGNFSYTTNEVGVKVTGYSGTDTTVSIPSEINGTPVKIIGAQSFWYNANISKVVLPNSITKIEEQAFQGCTALNEINLPEGITHIGTPETGGAVFYGCTSLTNIVLPESLTYLHGSMFQGTKITNIRIPENVNYLGPWVFVNAGLLEEVQFTGPLPSEIAGVTFAGNSSNLVIKYISGLPRWTNATNFWPNVNLQSYAAALSISTNYRGTAAALPAPNLENGKAYALGSQVSLTPMPNSNFVFSHWSGDVASTNNPLNLILSTGKTIVPNFSIARPASPNIQLVRKTRPTNFPLQLEDSTNGYKGTVFANGELLPEEFYANVEKISRGSYPGHFAIKNQKLFANSNSPESPYWGYQQEVYFNLNGVIEVVANNSTAYALLSNGTIVSFGLLLTNNSSITNIYSETDPNENFISEEVSFPLVTSDFVQIDGSYWCTIGLKADGTVVGWGNSIRGTLPIPANLTNIVQISVGNDFALALRVDGTVVGWGGKTKSRIPPTFQNKNQEKPPLWLSNVVSISAGNEHSLALLEDGSVVAWGDNTYGQCNVPAGLINVAYIAAGTYGSAALLSNGDVVGWGFERPAGAPAWLIGYDNYNPHGLKNVIDLKLNNWGFVTLSAFNMFRLNMANNSDKGLFITDPAYPTSGYFTENSIVEINVNPKPGYLFSHFSGDIQETNNPSYVLIDTNKNIDINYVNDNRDIDGDALSNYDEIITYNTNPANPDSNNDGINDGRAIQLGYSAFFNFYPLIESLRQNPISGLYNENQYNSNRLAGILDGLALASNNPSILNLYTKAQYDENHTNGFTKGIESVLSNPNLHSLYTTNQIHNLGFGGIILNRDTNNQLVLKYHILQSTDLQNWSPYGQEQELPIIDAPSDKMFLRVQAVGQ